MTTQRLIKNHHSLLNPCPALQEVSKAYVNCDERSALWRSGLFGEGIEISHWEHFKPSTNYRSLVVLLLEH